MSSTEARTPGVGDVVARRYRIESVIGTGGMAVVYRAVDEDLGRPVALKVFRADVVDAASVARQAEEIRLIASLDHPALVTLYDAVPGIEGDDHATGVLVMQLVEGRDLRHRLAEDGPLAPTAVAGIGADVAAALAYVHGRGVIHRDISPGNVLLPDRQDDGSPSARLADFGIARLIDSAGLTQTGTIIGTATYLSPEQAEGKPLTPASDVYSLGLTLLEALTGERSFPGTAIESAMARLSSDPVIPGSLGDGWAGLLSAMTLRSPAQRPTALEVLGTLRELQNGADDDAPAATALLPVATAVLPAPADAPTKVLPAASAGVTERLAPAGATEVLRRETVTTGSPAPVTRPAPDRRRALLIVGAIAAAAIVALIVANLAGLGGPADPPAEPESSTSAPSEEAEEPVQEPVEPVYPAVAGELGASLAALQQLVAYGTLDEALAATLQQQVLAVSTSAAAGDFETARSQLDDVRSTVDGARDSGLIDKDASDALRRSIDEVKKDLDEALDAADDRDKPGKGPKNG